MVKRVGAIAASFAVVVVLILLGTRTGDKTSIPAPTVAPATPMSSPTPVGSATPDPAVWAARSVRPPPPLPSATPSTRQGQEGPGPGI